MQPTTSILFSGKNTESIAIKSNLFCLPPVIKEGELHLILYQNEQQRVWETICSFNIESKQWRNREVITTSSLNQKAFMVKSLPYFVPQP